jgi:20S proteasome alpha/beta subunit
LSFQHEDLLAGAFTGSGDAEHDQALKFLHGTTTLGFVFSGGIIIAVDSRASMGSYVGMSVRSSSDSRISRFF